MPTYHLKVIIYFDYVSQDIGPCFIPGVAAANHSHINNFDGVDRLEKHQQTALCATVRNMHVGRR